MSLKTFLVFFLFIFFCGLVIFFKETIFDKFSSNFVDRNPEQILHQLEHAPDFYLDSVNASSPISETENCHFFNCFNIYRCVDHSGKQKKFHVHIPAPKRFLTKPDKNNYEEVSPFTLEFVEILEAISESDYYTNDPKQACIFVPALDLLNEFQLKDPSLASKALEFASPHWKGSNGGENHLLISFYPGSPSSK
jgi:glucuronyl/N-acetylglucosaminyl transferase EXT2